MNIQSFVAAGKDYKRAGSLLIELEGQQKDKPDEKDCTGLITDLLYGSGTEYLNTTFVEARDSAGKLCGVAIYEVEFDMFYIDFLCSDCPGTGREIINYIAKQASAERKWKIGLTSVTRSVGFYEKVGFRVPPDARPRLSGKYMEMPIVPAPKPPKGPAAAGAVELPGGRRKAYRRRKSRKHGSASLRRHKTRRVL